MTGAINNLDAMLFDGSGWVVGMVVVLVLGAVIARELLVLLVAPLPLGFLWIGLGIFVGPSLAAVAVVVAFLWICVRLREESVHRMRAGTLRGEALRAGRARRNGRLLKPMTVRRFTG